MRLTDTKRAEVGNFMAKLNRMPIVLVNRTVWVYNRTGYHNLTLAKRLCLTGSSNRSHSFSFTFDVRCSQIQAVTYLELHGFHLRVCAVALASANASSFCLVPLALFWSICSFSSLSSFLYPWLNE